MLENLIKPASLKTKSHQKHHDMHVFFLYFLITRQTQKNTHHKKKKASRAALDVTLIPGHAEHSVHHLLEDLNLIEWDDVLSILSDSKF